MLRVKHLEHFTLLNDEQGGTSNRRSRPHANRLSCQTAFTKKVSRSQNGDDRFFPDFIDHSEPFATERLASLRKLISHPESVHQARVVMAEQFGKLTLTPVRVNGILSYGARGKVDFYGEEAMIRVGGAGGQNRTGYARLFRAALYH